MRRDAMLDDDEPVHYQGWWQSQFNPGLIDCELDADEEGHTSDDEEGDFENDHSSSGHSDGNEADSARVNGSAKSTMQIYAKHI